MFARDRHRGVFVDVGQRRFTCANRSKDNFDVGPRRSRILNKAAGTITVGNPKVADITLGTGNALILTGKSPGITYVIAMDQAGAEFFRANDSGCHWK